MPEAKCAQGTIPIEGNVKVTDMKTHTLVGVHDLKAMLALQSALEVNKQLTLKSDMLGRVFRDGKAVTTTTVSGEISIVAIE